MNRKVRVEEMRQSNTLGLRRNLEGFPVTVETEGTAGLRKVQSKFRVSVDENFRQTMLATIYDV